MSVKKSAKSGSAQNGKAQNGKAQNGKFHVSVEQFRGRPTLSIRQKPEDQFPKFACQQEKARVIVDHIDLIRRFAKSGSI